MAFVFKYTMDGTNPVTKYYQMSNVSVTKGELLYFSSGYVTNAAFADCDTNEVAGVAEATIDNTGGSAGDESMPVQANRAAVFEVGTDDTMTQAYVGHNCALASTTTITSATDQANSNGVCKIQKMVDADTVHVSINFSDPGA